ncbi:MAG TPA: SDR family oxidoreductase [Chitinophagales bacterium]|nr:SDR family oxidoreductase [Chitinophagales bacterium]
MKGKNVIITGGNAGIGLATSIGIAKQGANVYIVARTKEKGEQAIKEIKTASGNNNVKYFVANLSSQKSVRQLAADIRKELSVIDVLINNAGGTFAEFGLTEDGLETTIATNHFAYFLLTNLLLDLIKKSDYARIVNVASHSHYRGKIDFDSFTGDKNYFIMRAYEQSKLANVLFTNELADRLSGTSVTVNSLHPGVVKTQIGNKNSNWYSSLFWSLMTKIAGISLEDGAKTSIYLATSPEVKNVTGKYFAKSKEKKPSLLALDKELGKKLWKRSEELCSLN